MTRPQRREKCIGGWFPTALAACLLAVGPVTAQTTDHPVLLSAIEAYDAGELQRALTILDSASDSLNPHDSAVRSLYLGLARFALGDPVRAVEAFAYAVRTEPPIRLNPNVHSPARVAAFEAARAGVVEEFRAAAQAADSRGDAAAALERWRTLLLAEPTDVQAIERIGALEDGVRRAEEERQQLEEARRPALDSIGTPSVSPASPNEDSGVATTARRYNPGQAFALGLLVPGLGQMYAGRRVLGVLALGAAGGALAAGFLSERIEVDCASVPVGDVCPPADVLEERSRRPFLVPALAAAAGITVLGAIDALLAARRSNARGAAATPDDGSPVEGLRILAPAIVADGAVLRADFVRLRFR